MERINVPGSGPRHEALRFQAYRHFRKLFLGNTCEEAALLAKPAPLGWRDLAKITGLKLAGGAICIEIQDPFAWQRTIAGAVLSDFLASCEHHGVELYFDRAFQLALWRLAE
jgi:hypothetical protein